MKRIVVTGMSGMIGTRFNQLFGKNFELINADVNQGVDITNVENISSFIQTRKPEAIIHLAAFTDVNSAHLQNGDKSNSCYRVNVEGTHNIAQLAQQLNLYLIHISTDFVFDGTKETPYTEEDTPNPIEWYGQTKWWAEEAVNSSQAKAVILRIAYPYQANPMRPDFVSKLKEKIQTNTLPPAFTNHWVTPTFVDDLCQLFSLCVESEPTGVYHAMGSSWHTDFEMAQMVKNAFSLKGDIKPGNLEDFLKTAPRPYQKFLKVSNRKLTEELGIRMKTFEEGLEIISR